MPVTQFGSKDLNWFTTIVFFKGQFCGFYFDTIVVMFGSGKVVIVSRNMTVVHRERGEWFFLAACTLVTCLSHLEVMCGLLCLWHGMLDLWLCS